MTSSIILRFGLAVLAASAGCSSAPGRPTPGSEVLRPGKVMDFETLYQQNCTGCHGGQGKVGSAVGMENGVYLAIADDATIRRAIAAGVHETAMPAFAQSSGGML